MKFASFGDQQSSSMAYYHQIFVRRNDISGHAAAGFAYQRPMSTVGAFIQFQPEPATSLRDRRAHKGRILADACCEYDSINAIECGG
jgi:hypothetical protein